MMFDWKSRFWNKLNILAYWYWDCDSPNHKTYVKKKENFDHVELYLLKHPTLMTEKNYILITCLSYGSFEVHTFKHV